MPIFFGSRNQVVLLAPHVGRVKVAARNPVLKLVLCRAVFSVKGVVDPGFKPLWRGHLTVSYAVEFKRILHPKIDFVGLRFFAEVVVICGAFIWREKVSVSRLPCASVKYVETALPRPVIHHQRLAVSVNYLAIAKPILEGRSLSLGYAPALLQHPRA